MVEGAALEKQCAVCPYRGFESHSLRHSSMINYVDDWAMGEKNENHRFGVRGAQSKK